MSQLPTTDDDNVNAGELTGEPRHFYGYGWQWDEKSKKWIKDDSFHESSIVEAPCAITIDGKQHEITARMLLLILDEARKGLVKRARYERTTFGVLSGEALEYSVKIQMELRRNVRRLDE